jgi:hypothetical protein
MTLTRGVVAEAIDEATNNVDKPKEGHVVCKEQTWQQAVCDISIYLFCYFIINIIFDLI